jgi:hypothetical protein
MQQQPQQLPNVRQLQRAFSDDAVVRLASITRSSSSSGASSNGEAGNAAADRQQQQQPEGVGAVTPLLESTAGAGAADVANSAASTRTGGFENPFGAPTVQQQQQQQQPGDALPAQQQQQQEASAGACAPVAPGADPFAAAAVMSKGEAFAVKHCLATFFLREEVCWECPKEKALWRERRLSAAGSAGSGPGRVSFDGRANRVSFEGSSSAGGGAGMCAACSHSKQQEAEGGGVAIVAPHPRLQQLMEGAEDEEGAIFKQVSFSDREPQVRLNKQEAVYAIKHRIRRCSCQGGVSLARPMLGT